MRKLVVFGDSYVEGQRKDPKLMITKYNPCYYLEKELGVEVINKGKFGSGNQTIANAVMRFCRQNDMRNIAIVVVWSDIMRHAELNRHMTSKTAMDFDAWEYISSGSVSLEGKAYKPAAYLNPAFHRMWFEQAMHSVRAVCNDYDVPLLMTNSIDTNPFLNTVFWYQRERHIDFCLAKAREQWIEGDKPNNSMFDIITDRWLKKDIRDLTFTKKHTMIRNDYEKDKTKYPYLTDCFHPWDEGNELIAKTLAPYIKPILEK